MKFPADFDEDENAEAEEETGMNETVHGNENESTEGNKHEGWKVMGFGLAWFWLLTSGT
jgi:hypothetical protein